MKKHARILLSHGGGGSLTRRLISDVFVKHLGNALLAPLNDQAVFEAASKRLAFTTDSYVIDPIFFPGGDIGGLSVCGTINDLAVGGATPLYLSASFIIEEGLPADDLEKIVMSMAAATRAAGVKIITGDTKVVERGKGDKIFINTAGIGAVGDSITLDPVRITPGDVVLVSGTVGDHGIAIMAGRHGLQDMPVVSDCAALHSLTKDMLATGMDIKAMRDPTRGGLATVIAEFAAASNCAIVIREDAVPVKDAVRGACELLGFDPLYLANEGKLLAVVARDGAEALLAAMRKNPLGAHAAIIGEVVKNPAGRAILETPIGNKRILDMLTGEQLPRIC